jgi:SAM-dependent methyltransferase
MPDTEIASHGDALLRGIPLVCPIDRTPLGAGADTLRCPLCNTLFPVVQGVPVILNDSNSVFAVADYVAGGGYEGPNYVRAADKIGGLRRAWRRIAGYLSDAPTSIRSPSPSDILAYVAGERPGPRVLVIGSGGRRLGGPDARIIHTDVAFGPAVDAIADAHDIPFPDGSFDLVVAEAVLEHVADPARCVAEIWRVLNAGGFVFAVTPFLQPVHMGAYDFTRFTPIGHRRIFRAFDEVAAGLAMGVGSVAAWTLGAVLQSAFGWRPWRMAGRAIGLLATPPLRLLDRWLRHGAEAAGGCWFFGRRRTGAPVSDRELVHGYLDCFGSGLTGADVVAARLNVSTSAVSSAP